MIVKKQQMLNTNRWLLVENIEKYNNTIIGNSNIKNTLSNNNEKKIPNLESSLTRNISPKERIIKYFDK